MTAPSSSASSSSASSMGSEFTFFLPTSTGCHEFKKQFKRGIDAISYVTRLFEDKAKLSLPKENGKKTIINLANCTAFVHRVEENTLEGEEDHSPYSSNWVELFFTDSCPNIIAPVGDEEEVRLFELTNAEVVKLSGKVNKITTTVVFRMSKLSKGEFL